MNRVRGLTECLWAADPGDRSLTSAPRLWASSVREEGAIMWRSGGRGFWGERRVLTERFWLRSKQSLSVRWLKNKWLLCDAPRAAERPAPQQQLFQLHFLKTIAAERPRSANSTADPSHSSGQQNLHALQRWEKWERRSKAAWRRNNFSFLHQFLWTRWSPHGRRRDFRETVSSSCSSHL